MGKGRSKLKGYNEYESTGEYIDGFKVIEKIGGGPSSLPRFSNSPDTVYILKSNGVYKSLGIYNEHRELTKQIDIRHGHVNKTKKGKREKLVKGVAHVHNIRGGRLNNVRYMTDKEIKKYGKAITLMGGRTKR